MRERKREINSISGYAVVLLSVTALLAVLSGYMEPPQGDEGAGAHLFQLSIVALAPTIPLFLGTADWRQPLRSIRTLAFSAGVLVLAFGSLYYLEHYRDPNYAGRTAGKSGSGTATGRGNPANRDEAEIRINAQPKPERRLSTRDELHDRA